MKIYCCGCMQKVKANLVSGRVIYPHRRDLWWKLHFQCPTCNNYVGTHGNRKKDETPRPLGTIPTAELRKVRTELHKLIDPLWKSGRIRRGELYAQISKAIKCDYHTGEVNSIVQARRITEIVKRIRSNLK